MRDIKIERAVEILENYLRGDEPDYAPDLPAAIRLGIEALKARKRDREFGYVDLEDLLPSETK